MLNQPTIEKMGRRSQPRRARPNHHNRQLALVHFNLHRPSSIQRSVTLSTEID